MSFSNEFGFKPLNKEKTLVNDFGFKPRSEKPQPEQEESFLESIPRQAAQYTSRALERVGGFPQDVKDFIGDLVIHSYEHASLGMPTGEKQREAPQTLKNLLGKSEIQEKMPSSSKLKEISEKASKGYTAPKSELEERIGTTVGDIASTLLPGGGAKSVYNNLLIPLGANLVEEGLGKIGATEDQQLKGKLGTWFTLSLFNRANANKFASNMRQKALSKLPEQFEIDPEAIVAKMSDIENKFLSNDPKTAAAKSQVEGIIKDVQKGRHDAQTLIERIDSINKSIDAGGGFELPQASNKPLRSASIKELNKVKSGVYDLLRDEVGKAHPEFWTDFKNSQEAFSAIHKSNRFVDYLKKHASKLVSPSLASLVGEAYYAGPGTALATGAGVAGGAYALNKAGQVLYRIKKDPNLRKHYLNAVKASLDDNKTVFLQNIQALDKKMAEEDKKFKNQKEIPNRKLKEKDLRKTKT